ncbi:TATA-box binding protein [Histomonas meleagridis]|uniref:TATA-box binding protein n=1 Tax=Histomonas meleagridis TaxID=135588 RepID=UPI00355A7EAE|nr:TATA-box binding protein [Histomonas meleagridis]KAH0804024.1 TATA-box binding protein [Histomonas meleagridis]
MDSAEFIGLNDELTEKTLKQYEELAQEEQQDNGDASNDDFSAIQALKPRIVNMVACVDYGSDLDLLKIATHARNAEFNPKRFPAVTLRIHEPKATGLVFKNGKTNIVGCKTEEDCLLAARKFGRLLKTLGFIVRLKSFTIANIVATMDCKFPIHLESLASRHKIFATYNPEVFAGLIYRIPKPKATFIVFVSGKIIITGTKSIENIVTATTIFHPILQQFARNFPLPADIPKAISPQPSVMAS